MQTVKEIVVFRLKNKVLKESQKWGYGNPKGKQGLIFKGNETMGMERLIFQLKNRVSE
jgi:hypothetical protein